MNKNYLHPINPKGKFRPKDYQVTSENTLQDNTRIKTFEARNPAVSHGYRHGAQVEIPGKPSIMLFGSHDEIQGLQSSVKENPERAIRNLKPLGKSRHFSLNGHLESNKPTHNMPTEDEASNYVRAQKLYPNHDSESGLTDKHLEEKRAVRDHRQELADRKNPYPQSTAEGIEWNKNRMNPSKPKATELGSTLVTSAPPVDDAGAEL